ncbi:hypothetical protein H9L21_03295 [Aeromicrobium senzhongii]|uniref:O-antigen ligase domain-containing protein n=1 Tax=Aeromicrobium senzhongii TaxID=2663859 RepID=A0ABX6SX17_9ACTN|nr:hypothetical protein [Aeromicrobium senzhongii]MTB88001.1 hypothetical protein [Aeromicrobium senzhongii]QNL94989.1 hypothetical protein H9L21_03295 [Aeromicrobium senzhongii]
MSRQNAAHVPPRIRSSSVALDAELVQFLAMALVLATALRLPLPLGVPLGFLVGVPLLPITATAMRRYRFVPLFVGMCAVAAVSGVLLTMQFSPEAGWDASILFANTVRVLSLAVGVVSLLWARTVVGLRTVVLVFGLGALANVAILGANPANVWKFSLSVPVILLALSGPWVFGNRNREFVVLIALTVVSALNDSRSAAAMLLIAAAIVLIQGGRAGTAGTARLRFVVVPVQLVVIAVAGYFAVQAAILEGALGEAARDRTVAQTTTAGSALLGGRPEIGATAALVDANPFGLGAGTLVSYDNLLLAKEGMRKIGYDPNNNYVEVYLFGNTYEVHSVLGNLWIQFGIAGLVTAALVGLILIHGLVVVSSERIARGVVVYLALRSLWDLPFSPFYTSAATLALALAVIAVPRRSTAPVADVT